MTTTVARRTHTPRSSALMRLFGPHLDGDEERRILAKAELVADGFIERHGFNFDSSDEMPSAEGLAERVWPAEIRKQERYLDRLDAVVPNDLKDDDGFRLNVPDTACNRWTPVMRAALYIGFAIGYRFAQYSAGREG